MKKAKAPTNPNRRKTQISISLPADLVSKIDILAEKENRNRSNFIATTLTELAESRQIEIE